MDDPAGIAVFFDIGDTLASVTLSADGHIAGLAVFPYVPGVLAALRDRGARLGIISDRGPIPAEEVDRALDVAGLRSFFAPELVVYGRKDSSAIFERAASLADGPRRKVFVGEDPGERVQAVQAGFQAVPHPLLALPALEDPSPLRYVRITVPQAHTSTEWRDALRAEPVLPLHVTGGGTTMYAVAPAGAAARLDDLGFHVDRLGGDGEPLSTDLYLLRDDRQLRSGFLRSEGNSADVFGGAAPAAGVLASTDEGLLVAVAAGGSVEDHHFRGAQHGHNLKLVPSPNLLEAAPAEGLASRALAAVSPAADVPIVGPTDEEILTAHVRPEQLAAYVERYSGARPLDTAGAVITSRHIQHPDNAAAVAALVADLQRAAGGCLVVRRHRFGHEGRRLDNVEAELAGTGLDGVVLVTAHLDSTAARQPGYRPTLDPAPGADDDASGTAAVLVAADAIAALDAALHTPRRAVRFVLFNAEEHGLVGSQAYARDQAALGTPIAAVLQLDMIGYNVRPGPEWELHAGFTESPAVEESSLALARIVARLAAQVSPDLPPAQVYPAPGEPDPAEQRSDHYSFQVRGYPACLASEDLFAGPGLNAPPEEMNPNYHSPTDKAVDFGYAADIARAMVAAAWITATR
jgi:bacterial leucyl aminopeptidase